LAIVTTLRSGTDSTVVAGAAGAAFTGSREQPVSAANRIAAAPNKAIFSQLPAFI
jgi:hypothetical protein